MNKVVDKNNKKIDPRRILYFDVDYKKHGGKKIEVINYGYFNSSIPSDNNGHLDISDLKKGRAKYSLFDTVLSIFLSPTTDEILKKMPRISSIDIFIEGTNLSASYSGEGNRIKTQLKTFEESQRKMFFQYTEGQLSNETQRRFDTFISKHPNLKEEGKEIFKEMGEIFKRIVSYLEKNDHIITSKKNNNDIDFISLYNSFAVTREKLQEEMNTSTINEFYKKFIELTLKIGEPIEEETKIKLHQNQEKYEEYNATLIEMDEIHKIAEELIARNEERETKNQIKTRVNYNNGNSSILDFEYFQRMLSTKISQDRVFSKEGKKGLKRIKNLRIGMIVCITMLAVDLLIMQIMSSKLKKASENTDGLQFNPKLEFVSKTNDLGQSLMETKDYDSYAQVQAERYIDSLNAINDQNFENQGLSNEVSKRSK